MNQNKDYSDILHLPHQQSKRHPPMSLRDRAAQFAPFAALTGYEGCLQEAERTTERRVFLDEEVQAGINRRLRQIAEGDGTAVRLTYFLPDAKKPGGQYVTKIGQVRRIDPICQTVLLQDGTLVPMADLIELTEAAQEG